MEKLIIPEGYTSSLDVVKTQKAIKEIKDFFQTNLAYALNLSRVSAPLFVKKSSGLNDNLSGIERPVSFETIEVKETELEIVQSLAKWKRLALKRYGFEPNTGLYADMNAIRRDEICDNTHSYYVDQWDWEKVITEDMRTIDYLHMVVKKIYNVFVQTDDFITYHYPQYHHFLPHEITFINSQELLDLYPDLDPVERENAFVKEKGAIFITQIGGKLSNGQPHDGRSPDYDDWELNGDLIIYNPILDSGLEMSSMGIRVDPDSLIKQLKETGEMQRLELDYHSMLVDGKLPLTIGGGIGQSRMCMLFMQKAHIGEVQASVWPEPMMRACENAGIHLL
ncbi:MAG: aspartate--ammonia ligase [Tissierellia bacterium]|nr:aspartate--ammonia ligase [Tissierellia bacterium]